MISMNIPYIVEANGQMDGRLFSRQFRMPFDRRFGRVDVPVHHQAEIVTANDYHATGKPRCSFLDSFESTLST